MMKKLSSRLWYALTSIPPIRPENLLPMVIMLTMWVGLGYLGLPEEESFVVVVVLAEAYAVWRNLPLAAQNLSKVESGKPGMLRWPVMVVLVLAGLQLWVADPLFTQRVITGLCVFVLIIMILGITRERDLLDRVVQDGGHLGQGIERVSLLRINAVTVASVIAVNEILIAYEALAVWMTAMPIFALFLHGFYWFMVLLVLPQEDGTCVSSNS